MRILCNYPVDAFQPRSEYREAEVITYGPADRKWIGDRQFPFDLTFSPDGGTLEQLLGLLPPGWWPDLILIYYPGQEPLPLGLERSPVPVVGVISDWNLHFEQLWGLAPFFDLVLADRLGTRIFRRAGYTETAYWPQYTYRTPWHYPRGLERDIDISFIGNMNPQVQGERMPWIRRVAALGDRHRVLVRGDVHNEAYGEVLARTRIGFNRSIRLEMNLRAFEICASQALLFMEKENREVREFLVPDREVILYDDADLEGKLAWFLEHEEERARIAAAGRARIENYSFARNLDRLGAVMTGVLPGWRAPAEPWEVALGRAEAMSRTWAEPNRILAAGVEAVRLNPTSARAHNALAAILTLHFPQTALQEIVAELTAARNLDPDHLPTRLNQAFVLHAAGRTDLARREYEEALALSDRTDAFDKLRGLVLPLRFTARENRLRGEAAMAVLESRPERLAAAYGVMARECLEELPAPAEAGA